jgi:NhaA family Na+:H+ antiporter
MARTWKKLVDFVLDNSLLLVLGAAAGLVWANLGTGGYHHLVDLPLLKVSWLGVASSDGTWHGITLHYLVNDILMAFFFALAGKEVWGAMLPGGHLRDPRRALAPVLCAVGGMVGPALIYVALASASGHWAALKSGWAVPTATDIAFSYLVAKAVFGIRHPATPFLLLLAIADDALGLVILAVCYPQGTLALPWLVLVALAVAAGWVMRELGVRHWGWYIAGPGVASWFALALAGIHPALALLPILPTLPHARHGEKDVRWRRWEYDDALDKMEAAFFHPVAAVLGLFGLLNAGVMLGTAGLPSLIVLTALVVGKPLGIFASGVLADRFTPLRLAEGISYRDLLALGFAAGIGFTVAIFMATVAFPAGATRDAAKIGALGSILAAGLTFIAAKVLKVKKVNG